MTWTLNKAAAEFGVTKVTVERGLRMNGVEIKPGGSYSTREVFAALAGDGKVERARLTRAQADREELAHRKDNGELLSKAEVEAVVRAWCGPIAELNATRSDRLSALCNPSDPELARVVLSDDAALERLKLAGDDANGNHQPG